MKKSFPHKVLILGAGKIGSCIAHMLSKTHCVGMSGWKHWDITIADKRINPALFGPAYTDSGLSCPEIKTRQLDLDNTDNLESVLAEFDSVISALPFHMNKAIAYAASIVSTSYFDLTEDVDTTQETKRCAYSAKQDQIFMPQCGLAPGFICVLGAELAKRFTSPHSIHLRVGALPKNPTNRLGYNLTWSTQGLVNEYCQPCEAVRDGLLVKVPPMDGLEHLMIDGVKYEAFNTSGGLGTLCSSLRINELDYKTIRYPGHCELMRFLLDELRFKMDQESLVSLLDKTIPATKQDVVLAHVYGTGLVGDRFCADSITHVVHGAKLWGTEWSAIQLTTAAGICAALYLHAHTDKLPRHGFVRQEDICYTDFLETPYGDFYASQS